jgi:hypothetical protein
VTATEKKERRAARHEMQRNVRRFVMRKMGLYSTTGQLKATIKLVADRVISEAVKGKA